MSLIPVRQFLQELADEMNVQTKDLTPEQKAQFASAANRMFGGPGFEQPKEHQ